MRIALGVEYDGAAFHGWQTQDGVRTVQECLEEALSQVADHPLRVQCAGRTDAGVHGCAQVVHFDTEAKRTERSWILGTNVNSPLDMNVLWAKEMPDDFHARFSAMGRHYRYEILNRVARSGITRDHAVWIHAPLDEQRMHEAAQALVGTHDFTSYRAVKCQAKSPIKEMRKLTVTRQGDRISLCVSANAFLHHMVRNIAGVLLAIGKGEQPVSWAAEVLALKDRTLAGVTAPPEGLYLTSVDYPEHFQVPKHKCPLF